MEGILKMSKTNLKKRLPRKYKREMWKQLV